MKKIIVSAAIVGCIVSGLGAAQSKEADNSKPVPEQVFVRKLLFANAMDVKSCIDTFSAAHASGAISLGKATVVADRHSNKILVVTTKWNMDFFDNMIEQMDVDTSPDVSIKAFVLHHEKGEFVAKVINELMGERKVKAIPLARMEGVVARANKEQWPEIECLIETLDIKIEKNPQKSEDSEKKTGWNWPWSSAE